MEFKIKIEQDEYAVSPREWDNLGTMACWHSNYELGDDQVDRTRVGVWLDGLLYDNGLARDTDQYDEFSTRLCDNWQDAMTKALNMLSTKLIVLPLYIYDHSGITMSTSNWRYPFTDPWDAGQVGYIFVPIADIKEEYSWKNLSPQRRAKINEYLVNEVKTYDQYLTGDVWYYVIEDEDENHYDSCGGFFGHDYCKGEAKEALKHVISENDLHEFERVI